MESKLAKYALGGENSKARAEIWSDFVGWDNRRRGENGFLLTQLHRFNCKEVFDIALGDGVDTIYLLQQGFEVESNEVDESYRQTAIENAKKAGFDISPTNLDWRELSKAYKENSFDAIISLGNSISCLFVRENQLKALGEFYKLLKPNSILIVDERNYQRIIDNREAALQGKLHSSGKYLYTGTDKVEAKFAEITEDYIIIEYTHKETGRKAYYKVYPFPRNELKNLLVESEFNKIEKFSDYKVGDNPEADLYQYVCVK